MPTAKFIKETNVRVALIYNTLRSNALLRAWLIGFTKNMLHPTDLVHKSSEFKATTRKLPSGDPRANHRIAISRAGACELDQKRT